LSEKRSHKKMVGIDVYICINNTDKEQYLTIGKPYRVLSIGRDHLFNLLFCVKNNKREELFYPSWRFKPRNERDDR